MYQIIQKCEKCGHEKSFETALDELTEIRCEYCNRVSAVIKPISGYIYILSNPCMSGMVKIGFTTRNVEERIKELNSASGVPNPFELEATFISNAPAKDETNIHAELSEVRVNEAREFFRIEPHDATNRISKIIGYEPTFSKLEIVTKRKNEKIKQKQKELESQGIFINDPGIGRASYSFICKECKHRFYSRTPKNSNIICPNCFSKEIL